MADNTIDSLEIKIESSADQAVRSLENLSAKLTTIKNTLGNTNVGFDLSGISKTTQAVEGLQKSVNKLPKNKLTLDASKIDAAIEGLRSKFADVGKDISVPKTLPELGKALASTEKSLDSLFAKESKLKQIGVNLDAQGFKSLEYDISATVNKLDLLRDAMDALKSKSFSTEGMTITRPDSQANLVDTPRVESVSASAMNYDPGAMAAVFGEAAARIKNYQQAIEEFGTDAGMALNSIDPAAQLAESSLENAANASTGAWSRLQSVFSPVISGLVAAQNTADRTGSIFDNWNRKIKEISKNLLLLPQRLAAVNKSSKGDGFSTGLKNLLKYSFGIRSLFVLLNKLRSFTIKGFENLAQYDSSGTNAAITSLTSSLLKLQNALAVAFSPIVQTVAPLLSGFINMIAEAANKVGQFFASLTGKSFTPQAVSVVKDYASSLDSTSSSADKTSNSAKKLKKALSVLPFDQLNQLTKKEETSTIGGGGGTKLSPSDMFETVPVSSKIQDLATDAKKYLGDFFGPFQSSWKKEGNATVTAAKTAFSNLGSLAGSVGKSFMTVWTNGSGEKTLTTTLKIAQNLFNTIGNLAQAFKTAWDYAGTGTSIIQNIFNLGNSILGTIERITSATANWAKTLDFTPLLSSINTLLQNLQPLTDNIGTGLEWFWSNVLLPIGSWTIQDAVPTFLGMLSSGISVVNSVIEALQPLGGWLWDNFLQPLGEWTGNAVIEAMKTVSGLLDGFSTWIQNNQGLVEGVTITIGSFFAAFELSKIIGSAAGLVTNFVSLVTSGGGLLGALGSVSSVLGGPVTIAIGAVIAAGVLLWRNWDTVKEAATKLKDWVVSKTIALKDGAVRAFNTLKTNAGNALTVLRDDVKQKWETIKSKFSSFSTWLSGAFNTDWTKQFGIFGGVLNGFFKSAKDVIKDVKGVFKGLTTFISGTFSGNWSQAWQGIKTIFTNVFSGLADIAKTPINAVIGGFNGVLGTVNGLISKLNNLKFRITVPNWVPGVGGSWWGFDGFNIPTIGTIPMLAKGGLVESATLATIGEKGKEAVLPLENPRTMKLIAKSITENLDSSAKLSLFNGAQVIGIGEAGSEAVLPLENPRTMKKIADSIVSSSDGSMGLTKEEMAKAVAQGVAMAMSMNSGNKNPQYIMNSIILDGNEIAKAVTKAQNDTDSRFKPSPAY